MHNLIVLIDPNDENLEGLINEVNSLKPLTVWVGCSTSSGNQVADVFRSLEIPADLYPGNFDQIKINHNLARKIYLPAPLFYSNPQIPNLLQEISQYAESQFFDKAEFMNYILLHPNCTAAKILGVTNSFSDTDVINKLGNTQVHPQIYLEGGSRNKISSIVDRHDLIKEISRKYSQSRIICGGGIYRLDDVISLKELGVDVVVSNAVHNNPKMLEKYMKLFE